MGQQRVSRQDLYSQGKVDDAISAYCLAAQAEPQRADIQADLGRSLESKGLGDDAFKAYQHAHDLAPADPAISRKVAELYYRRGLAYRQKDDLLDEIGQRLEQSVEHEPLFALRWHVT